MVHVLTLSKAPLSVRLDQDYKPTTDELEIARRIVAHIATDAAIRARLPTLKVEPLVRAASILLEEGRRTKGERAAVDPVLEYLNSLDHAFGNVPSVLNNRGVARSMTGDFAGADADFASARRLAPAFVAPRVNEIELARRAGDFVRLERIAQEIERADPGNVSALRASVDAKIALRRPSDDVLASARRLYDAKGARPNDLFLLGSLSLEASDPESAVRFLRELVAAEPRHIDGHIRLAMAFLEEGGNAEALGLYQKLVEIDGPRHEYLLAIAFIFDQMDRTDDAIRAYENALQRATERERDVVEEVFGEFKARRGLAPRAEPAPATAEPVAAPVPESPSKPAQTEIAPDPAADDPFEPKAIGDSTIYGIGPKEIPIEPPRPDPRLASPTKPPEIPLSREEQLAAAFESSSQGVEAGDDILGIPDADDEPLPPAPPAPDVGAPSDEAIVPAPPASESIVPEGPSYAPRSPSPTVSAPPPRPLAPVEPAASAPTPAPQPVVSAPPPEPADPDLEKELEALSQGGAPAPEPAEAEPFRRPTFDVDEFMEALEAKTRPVFDHLYDGMLEARRKEGPTSAVSEKPSSAYESAAPPEPAPPPPPNSAPPAPLAPEAPPPMPLLLAAAARDAVADAAPPAAPPEEAVSWGRLAELAAAGDPAAEVALDQFLQGAPADPHAWNLKGDLRERAGDENGALAAYRNAVKYGPGVKEAWNNLGVLLHVIGRFDDASQALEAAVAVDAHDRHLWHNLGSTYHELGRLDDALSAFNRAIEVDSDDKVSHNNKGTTLFEKGDFANARSAFERAVAIDPTFEQAHNNLGRTLEQLEDLEGALRAYQAALVLNDRSLTALRNLARVFDRLGRANDASTVRSKLRALGA